jgi:hypothetical protein
MTYGSRQIPDGQRRLANDRRRKCNSASVSGRLTAGSESEPFVVIRIVRETSNLDRVA